MQKYRHGDVNLHSVNKAEGEIIKHNGSFVVEWGEVTGHGHRLTVKNPEDLEIRKDSESNFYFILKSEGMLTHEEHKTLIVAPGTYKKVIEREFDHFSLAVRQVQD